MKFLEIIKKYEKGLVLEQDVPPDDVQPTEAPQPETEPVDEPAGIVSMGNLLKKALTMKLSDEDKFKVSQLPELNEKNAAQIISQISAIMKTYSVDIDLDNTPKTSI